MYRSVLLFCIFLTGMVSLVYQMVWQRYLAILVGSEAKSAALVVAIFLLGLAIGYAIFGNFTEKKHITHRRGLLRFYGWVELLTAAYVVIFPNYFVLLQKISFSGPISFIFDIFIIIIAILLPTILMGATIPLMTMVFPSAKDQTRNREIDSFHAKIYGVNTLGAFLGTIGGGYILIPWLGLPTSLMYMGVLNLLVSFVYIFNRLSGELVPRPAHSSTRRTPKKTSNHQIFYGLVFIIGAITIGLEILLIRIVGLTIGSNIYVFPTVLGIVVLGIGLGSLRVVQQVQTSFFTNESKKYLYYQTSILLQILIACVFLGFFYWSVTYLPSFINHIRISLVTISSNQFAFLFLTFLTLGAVLIPVFYALGGLLPLAYCCIDKDQKNYGKICGFLYFFNTVGSLVGGIFLGYALLHFLSLENVFRLCMYTLLAMGLILSLVYKQSQSKYLTRFTVFSVLFSVSVIILLLIPHWNRRHHYIGLFRNQELSSDHFTTWFLPEAYSGRPVFIEDGPNSTIAVLREDAYIEADPLQDEDEILIPGPGYETMSIIVNGKSDGNSWGDFPTVYALALLPYLHAPSHGQLNSAVIGFGTGITSGSLGRFNDIESVQTLEISSVLVKRHSVFDHVNFQLSENPKVSVVKNDAFKFLTHSKNMYDIIVAEPSNPWVVGVENLFSLDLYESAKTQLTTDGVFAQWFHTYSMNLDIVKMIYNNISSVFPYVISYRVGNDIIILAKNNPFSNLGQPSIVMSNRFVEPFIQRVNTTLGINHLLNIKALEITNESMSLHIGMTNTLGFHTLTAPKLTFLANKAFFLDESVSFYDIINYHILARHFYNEQHKMDALQRLSALEGTGCNGNAYISQPFCPWFQTINFLYTHYQETSSDAKQALMAYSTLRRLGFLSTDREFLENIATQQLETFDHSINDLLLREMYVEGLFFQADVYMDRLQSRGIITNTDLRAIQNRLEYIKDFISNDMPFIMRNIREHQGSLTL